MFASPIAIAYSSFGSIVGFLQCWTRVGSSDPRPWCGGTAPRRYWRWKGLIGRRLATNQKIAAASKEASSMVAFRAICCTIATRSISRPSGRSLNQVASRRCPYRPRSPNLNAHAGLWVRSIKDECLSKVILFGERGLKFGHTRSGSRRPQTH